MSLYDRLKHLRSISLEAAIYEYTDLDKTEIREVIESNYEPLQELCVCRDHCSFIPIHNLRNLVTLELVDTTLDGLDSLFRQGGQLESLIIVPLLDCVTAGRYSSSAWPTILRVSRGYPL